MSPLDFWKAYGSPVIEIATIAVLFLNLWIASKFATKLEMETVKTRIDKVEDGLASISADISHLPDKASFQRMQIDMTEMRGDLKVLNERIKPLAHITERLQEFLLEASKDKPTRARRTQS
jgi:Protein of unknown function (DUF2730)